MKENRIQSLIDFMGEYRVPTNLTDTEKLILYNKLQDIGVFTGREHHTLARRSLKMRRRERV
jgi:hypothetical protein